MEKFVQLGLKKKGRIVKNEQYTIEEFREKVCNCTPRMPQLNFSKFNLFDWMFRRKHIREDLERQLNNLIDGPHPSSYSFLMKSIFINRINELIDQDNF